jgi:hypothetical protein
MINHLKKLRTAALVMVWIASLSAATIAVYAESYAEQGG